MAATLISWDLLVGLILLGAFLCAVWSLSTLEFAHDALDADTTSYTDITRLPVRMYRGLSSSETPATLSGSQGDLASSILSDLPRINHVFNKLEELTCTVCQEQVLDHEGVKTLPCEHQFHSTCIDKWLREKRTCPMCRMGV